MQRVRRLKFWMKGAQALFLGIAVMFALGASDPGARFTDLGHRLMCTCGCSQMLGECNHVGCPESDRMRGELHDQIASVSNDKQVLDWFSSKYGVTVLAAPTTHGFNLVAWIAPFAVFLAALFGTILLVRHWSVGRTAIAAGSGGEGMTPEMAAIHDKIRRETGADGGF
jgi:cytochrome c-type biogenesis protein CcmH/NrfF